MKISMIALVPIVLCGSTMAEASPLLFDFTGQTFSGPVTASFQLDSNPMPDQINDQSAFGFGQVFFDDVAGTFNGNSEIASTISFGTGLASQFQISGTSLGFAQFGGQEVFTGSFSDPVFAPGTFHFTGFTSGTLTVTQLAAAVPEPASWAMMIGGIGLLGGAMRRQRAVRSSVTFA